MEDDRAQVDLGVAVDVEERLEEEAQKVPKRRFVGRRQAAEAATNSEANGSVDNKRTIQGTALRHNTQGLLTFDSLKVSKNSSDIEPSPARNTQRPSHQRRHRTPAPELLLRTPQDYTSNTDKWLEEGCSADARRLAAVRHHDFRHPHAVLPWNRDLDYGRCDLWSMLYR